MLDISEPEMETEYNLKGQYGSTIKCGEIQLNQNDWNLQLVCAECGKKVTELQEFLLHSLQHHFAVTEKEIESLISEVNCEKKDKETERNIDGNAEMISSGLVVQVDDDENNDQNYVVEKEYNSLHSTKKHGKPQAEKCEIQFCSEEIPESAALDETSPLLMKNSRVLQQLELADLVNAENTNHSKFEFLDTGNEESEAEEPNCNFINHKFNPTDSEIQDSENNVEYLNETKRTKGKDKASQQVEEILESESIVTEKDILPNLTSKQKTNKRNKQKDTVKPLQGTEQIKKKEHKCDICAKVFQRRTRLIYHKRVHDKVAFLTCEICGATFPDSRNLHTHLKRHLGIKKHKCTLCEKTFVASTELKIHMRSHTGERPYVCKECGVSYSTSSSYCNHIRRHTNDRPHGCETCGKRFFDKGSLRDHLISHTGEKAYSCNKCDKAFGLQKQLKQHMKIHSGIKAYVCKICDATFTQNAGLYSHMKRHKKTTES